MARPRPTGQRLERSSFKPRNTKDRQRRGSRKRRGRTTAVRAALLADTLIPDSGPPGERTPASVAFRPQPAALC